MKIYTNIVVINGIEFTNIVEASNYSEALAIQKNRKRKSKNTFKGRLVFNSFSQ